MSVTKSELLFFVLLSMTSAASAQWLDYPTPGIPRTPEGAPDLSAPAPKTADGHPDISGIWTLEPSCPPGGCVEFVTDYQVGQEFRNFGFKLPGGLPYQPWAAELFKKRSAELGLNDPVAACFPSGGPLRLLTFPPPRKIIQLPGLVVILSERDVTYRQIFTDGRPLPDDPEPTWLGYSIGSWVGDALVVETTGLRDGTWLDRLGSPLTSAARITERYRRVNFGRLEIDVTVDDPKAYTRPWTVTLTQLLMPDTELLNYHCMDYPAEPGER
jgi:hypothetical protein